MKKLICFILSLALLLCVSGCSCTQNDPPSAPIPSAAAPAASESASATEVPTPTEAPTLNPKGPEEGELPEMAIDIDGTASPELVYTQEPEDTSEPKDTPEPDATQTSEPTVTPTPFWGGTGGELELPELPIWDGYGDDS